MVRTSYGGGSDVGGGDFTDGGALWHGAAELVTSEKWKKILQRDEVRMGEGRKLKRLFAPLNHCIIGSHEKGILLTCSGHEISEVRCKWFCWVAEKNMTMMRISLMAEKFWVVFSSSYG